MNFYSSENKARLPKRTEVFIQHPGEQMRQGQLVGILIKLFDLTGGKVLHLELGIKQRYYH